MIHDILCARSRFQGRDTKLQPTDNVGCNHLSLSLIPASGTWPVQLRNLAVSPNVTLTWFSFYPTLYFIFVNVLITGIVITMYPLPELVLVQAEWYNAASWYSSIYRSKTLIVYKQTISITVIMIMHDALWYVLVNIKTATQQHIITTF